MPLTTDEDPLALSQEILDAFYKANRGIQKGSDPRTRRASC